MLMVMADLSNHDLQPLRSATPWLGVLFVLVFVLNSVGGWVRLSGSGVAIPHWPVLEVDGAKTLLPPMSDRGWQAMEQAWHEHQDRLRERIDRGELTAVNLGRQPADTAEFRRMFLIEWSHRCLAAITGLVAAGILTLVLRHRTLRVRVGWPVGTACALIVLQAVLGGLLVEEGTSTRWLFLHQANAAGIMGCLLWALLRLVDERNRVVLVAGRTPLRRMLAVALVAVWLELIFGALVSSSRQLVQGGLPMGPLAIVDLWDPRKGVDWNLLRNAEVHLWLHRWWAWIITTLLAVAYALAFRSPTGPRLRLALPVTGTFLLSQMILGLGAGAIADHGRSGDAVALLALAHQAMGMCLLLSLVLALFDVRREPSQAIAPAPSQALGNPS